MSGSLSGRRVAVLATDGFENAELSEPLQGLRAAGARADVISLKSDDIQGYDHHTPSEKAKVDKTLDEISEADYDALVLPGGVMNPDALRIEPQAIAFVRGFVRGNKPIAAVCHGPWTLIDAGGVYGKTMTSWPSLKMDLTNAGAKWVDEEVVVDGNLVTSRKPDDLPAFVEKTIDMIANAPKRAAAAE